MKRKFLSKGNKVLALALAAAMTFPMLPASTVKAAEASTPIYTDEATLPAGWTVSAGSVAGNNADKGGNATNKLTLSGKAKADYKLASAVSTGHVKLEYEVFNEGVANAMVIYDSDGKALINVGGAGSGNINIMPGYPDGAATGTDYATSGKVFEWVGGSKAAWRKVSIDIDLDKSNKDGVLNFTLNFYEPDGDYKGKDTKWKLFAAEDVDNGQKRDGQFTQAAYTAPRGNNKGGNIVDAGSHPNGAATPGITKFGVAGIQLVSAGEGPIYDNMVLTTGTADAAPATSASTPAPSKPATTTTTTNPSVSGGNEGSTYTVQRGDTLYGIAKKLLGNGSKWIDIYNLNSATIKDAQLIFAGQVLQVNGSVSTGTSAPATSTKTPAPSTSTPAPSTAKATGTPIYTDEAALGAGWTVSAGSVAGNNTDKGGNTTNKLALASKAKADYKLASAVSTGHVKLEYEVFSDGVANAMVIYDNDGKALINVGGAGSGNINIMPGYPDGAATGTDYATSGKVFEWVGLSKSAWRKISIDIDLDKSNKDGVLNFTLNVYEPDGDYKGADTKWKLFAAEDVDNGQKRDGQFTQAAYTAPRGNNKGGNIVDAGSHPNGAATPGITKFSVAGIQLVSAGEGPFYDNMVLTTN